MGAAVLILGDWAKQVLAAAGEVQVWGRTSQAIFVNAAGEMLWVSPPQAFAHRRALVATQLPAWPPDAHLQVRNQTMMAETGEALSLDTAKTWYSPKLPEPLPEFPSLAQLLLHEFFPRFQPVLESLGFNDFRALQPTTPDLPGFLTTIGEELMGHGPGLTPVGDDVLGGMLFASYTIQPHGHLIPAWVEGKTSRLSFCLLSDLSQGHGPEPLHCFAAALFRCSVSQARFWMHRLFCWGHTTGTGLALGALAMWCWFGGKGAMDAGC